MRTAIACVLVSTLFLAPARAQTVSAETDVTTPFADSTAETQSALLLVPDRSGYLVLYRDRTTPGDSATRATRLAPDGTAMSDLAMQLPHAPLDAACTTGGDCAAVGVELTFDGSTYVPHTFVMRFRDDGAALDSVEVTSSRGAVSEPTIELAASGWLLAYTGSDGTTGPRPSSHSAALAAN